MPSYLAEKEKKLLERITKLRDDQIIVLFELSDIHFEDKYFEDLIKEIRKNGPFGSGYLGTLLDEGKQDKLKRWLETFEKLNK